MKDTFGMPMESHSDGDSMMWAGLMTAVGDAGPTKGIKMCQTEDGRMWRSPSRVNNQPTNSFSRDMALGFILYVQTTKDYEMADKWVAYIKKTGSFFPASESTDNRHLLTPTIWWCMSYAGIKGVPLKYRMTRWLLKYYQRLAIMFSPKGYQTHLQAVVALIRALHNSTLDLDVGEALLDKEPDNPFFLWLAGWPILADLMSSRMQREHSFNPGNGTQWAWQRTGKERTWMNSMGWDFKFIEMLTSIPMRNQYE